MMSRESIWQNIFASEYEAVLVLFSPSYLSGSSQKDGPEIRRRAEETPILFPQERAGTKLIDGFIATARRQKKAGNRTMKRILRCHCESFYRRFLQLSRVGAIVRVRGGEKDFLIAACDRFFLLKNRRRLPGPSAGISFVRLGMWCDLQVLPAPRDARRTWLITL